ncbi:MAG TPA: hypothetical protein VEQ35_07410, partial [Beijerinckia sp.]|nr:hypothetical protein [Beijerinckia sp.]
SCQTTSLDLEPAAISARAIDHATGNSQAKSPLRLPPPPRPIPLSAFRKFHPPEVVAVGREVEI